MTDRELDKMLEVKTPGHKPWCMCDKCYVAALIDGSAAEPGVGLPRPKGFKKS